MPSHEQNWRLHQEQATRARSSLYHTRHLQSRAADNAGRGGGKTGLDSGHGYSSDNEAVSSGGGMRLATLWQQLPPPERMSVAVNLAEGTGLEPATGFPAPHFQCGR